MEIVQSWLEQLYDQRISDNYDATVLVVGDEGVGKSTLMLELVGRYQQLRDVEPSTESVLDTIVWSDRNEFKHMIGSRASGTAITTPDAARVLHKKRGMTGEQVELEMDLLDVRAKNFMFLFGYQDWGVVASILQERRAQFCLRIPKRGVVEGYSREKLDEKMELERDEWPDPNWVDSFPNLDGTDLWDAYRDRDLEAKEKRMAAASTDPDDVARREQVKIALRACKPWVEEAGMDQAAAANLLLDYSPSWVSRRFSEWERGEWDSLVEDTEGVEPPDDVGPSVQASDIVDQTTEAG